jgi:ribosomal protein S18 acetylase RimI-like enzyme
VNASLRNADPADVNAIVDLVNAVYQETESFFTDELRTSYDEVARLVALGEFIVADRASEILGAVHCHIDPPRGHFGMLAVAASQRRNGLGRALIAEVERRSAAAGCSEVHLEVVDARVELPPWYNRMGYVATGAAPYVRPPEQMKMPVAFIVMAKRIQPAPAEEEM